MRDVKQKGRVSHQVRCSLLCALVGLLWLPTTTACRDTTTSLTAASSSTAELPTVAGSATVVAIELTDKGFSPDRSEAKQGTRLTLRNATGTKQSVVVKGRD